MKNMSLLFLVLCSCGAAPLVNPCITKSASYVVRAVETTGGTCGAVPDQIINVSSDGEIGSAASSPVVCDKEEMDNCTLRKSGCKNTANGVTCTSASSVTIDADGTKGSGGITLNCSGAATCVSSYNVTYTRN